jgi:hypothetical protein
MRDLLSKQNSQGIGVEAKKRAESRVSLSFLPFVKLPLQRRSKSLLQPGFGLIATLPRALACLQSDELVFSCRSADCSSVKEEEW